MRTTVLAMLFAFVAVIFGAPLSTLDRLSAIDAQVKRLELYRVKVANESKVSEQGACGSSYCTGGWKCCGSYCC